MTFNVHEDATAHYKQRWMFAMTSKKKRKQAKNMYKDKYNKSYAKLILKSIII